ncbi:MAG: SEC-C metal-binding domain-containing protein [Planctomycetota bacterium]
MSIREITLDTAAFLESSHARVEGASSSDVQAVIERFLACVYDGLGKAPRLLDGDDLHGILGHLLPAQFAKKDPLAKWVGPALRKYFDFLEERAILSQSYEIRRSLEESLSLFSSIVEKGMKHSHGHGGGETIKPFVNKADKVGRNDPCPCGSGKKFKQCCAKL